ncbi:MAG: maternal effect embryo arrest 50 [Trebouxia sp. A1-2]|nr:MAG: maternal effect embryo arrest 50 [Trebouxia sp. A1-2]
MTSLMRYSSRGPQNCLQVLRLEPCLEHVIMLQLLADELEDPVDATRSQAWQSPVASLNFAMYWVQEMCVLRALTAQDEAEKRQDGIPKDQLITLLTLALAMLAALNPIQPPRRHATPTQQPASTQAQPSSEATLLSKERNPPNADAHVSGPTADLQMQEAELSPAGSQAHQAADLHITPGHQAAPGLLADLASQHDSLQGHSRSDAGNQSLSQAVNRLLSQQDSGSPEQLIRLAQQFPRQSPYKGYRCDLVALLANLCFRRPAVQNKVQQLGGTELILSQCQWDDENPLVREYGLWAVRNLCEGNDAIQESISSLRAHSTVDSPDLQQIGMKIELDGKTGKPKMVAQGA